MELSVINGSEGCRTYGGDLGLDFLSGVRHDWSCGKSKAKLVSPVNHVFHVEILFWIIDSSSIG